MGGKTFRLASEYPQWTAEELAILSVGVDCKRRYEAALRGQERLGLPLTFAGLVTRVYLQDGSCSKTLKNLLWALEWHRRKQGKLPYSQEQKDFLDKQLRGRTAAMGARKPKGAITHAMLCDMLEWMGGAGASGELVRSMAIAWGTGLRHCQIVELTKGNFLHRDGAWLVDVRARHRGPTADPNTFVTQPVEARIQGLIAEFLPTLARDEDKVCPGWKESIVNGWIQRAAVALSWDPNLSWLGAQQLRHGVAVERSGAGDAAGIESARELLGHTAPRPPAMSTTKRYTKTNAQRVAGFTQATARFARAGGAGAAEREDGERG